MSGLLQACEAPPGAGQVTVAEVECRFLARDADEEPNIAAVSLVNNALHSIQGLQSRDIICNCRVYLICMWML